MVTLRMTQKLRIFVASVAIIFVTTTSAQTLRNVVRHTVCTNPEYLVARANEDATRHAVREAEGEFLPQVSAFYATGRERTTSVAQRLATDMAAIKLDRTEARISATQLLFNGGRVYKTVKARSYDYSAARFRTHNVREMVILETAEAYLDILKYRQLVDVATFNVKVHKETLDKARAKYKGGAGRRVDVELGISRLAKAGAQLDAFVGDLQESVSRYTAITGLVPSSGMEMPVQRDKWLPPTLRIAIKQAVDRNPAVQIANSDFLASDARVGVATSAFWPSISAEASATDNENLDGIAGPNRDNTISLVGRYDLFRGGSDLAAWKISRAERLRSMRESQLIRREIIEEVRISWAKMMAARAEIKKLKIHVVASGKVVVDYKKQFEIGARPLFNVLDAENDHFNAKVAYTNARFNNATSFYRILQGVGCITAVLLGHGS